MKSELAASSYDLEERTEDAPRSSRDAPAYVAYNVTFSRLYKDGDKWQNTQSFGRGDLLTLSKVADLAHTRIYSLPQEPTDEAGELMSPSRIQSAAGSQPRVSLTLFPRFQVPPFPLVVHCCGPRSSPSRDALARFAPWAAAGRAGKPDLLPRKKGGSVASVAGGDHHGPLPVFGFSWNRPLSPGPGHVPGSPRARPGQAPLLVAICHAGVL